MSNLAKFLTLLLFSTFLASSCSIVKRSEREFLTCPGQSTLMVKKHDFPTAAARERKLDRIHNKQ